MKRITILFCLTVIFCSFFPSLYGAETIMDDSFTSYRHDRAIWESGLKHLKSIGYEDEGALLQMDIPKQWRVNWDTFPKNCTYGKDEKGFSIHSPDDVLQIFAQGFDIRNCKCVVSIDISNASREKDAEISSGWKDSNTLLEFGTKPLKTVTLEPNARKQLTYEFSCLDGFEQSRVFINVRGDAILHHFKMEMTPIPGITCVEGTIVERSKLLDTKTNDSSCRYTIRLKGNAILAGEKCNREIVLTLDGVRNKKTLKTDTLKVGDQIECVIAPFDRLSEKDRKTKVSNDLNVSDLDNYYVYAIRKVSSFSLLPTFPSDKDCFFSLYDDLDFEIVTLEGTVRAVSTVPDPEKNDYDDCLYSVMMEADSIISYNGSSSEISQELILNVPIMKDKMILKDNVLHSGDKIQWTCALYDDMSEKIREIQLSDDFQSFEHDYYYVLNLRKIKSFSSVGTKNFSKRQKTILPIQSLPRDENAAKLRKERIQSEIARIEEEVKKHGGSFASWKEEYKPIAEKYKKLAKDKFSGWIRDSYFAAGGGETIYKTEEYIEGIMPFKKYLEENNIDLIVVRIPSKSDFAARVLAADDFQENPDWVEHYYKCLKNDIEIIDPMPEMWKQRFDFPLFYFYNAPNESHPFEGALYSSAQKVADILKRYPYPLSETSLTADNGEYNTKDPIYFWPDGNMKYNPKENMSFKQVAQNGKNIQSLAVNTGSPFIFLSNSFFAPSPMRDRGASLPAYVAFFIQHIPDWFCQYGIENPMLRNLISNPEFLARRRAVVMVGHPGYWQGGFLSIPQYIRDKAKSISLENSFELVSPDVSIEESGFIFKKNSEGGVQFSSDASKNFSIYLNLPAVEKKEMCMLRINFLRNTYMTINVYDSGSGAVIDTVQLSSGSNSHADLFIPASDDSRKIQIQFSLRYPEELSTCKNIELWYY